LIRGGYVRTQIRQAWFGGLSAAMAALAEPANSEHLIILDPTQTVRLEHQDRVNRLRRAAEALNISPAPEFHEMVVPADRLPPSFHVDVPVLRVVFAEKSFFDTAQSVIRPEAAPILDAIAQALRGDAPDTAVFVAGHTDSRGSEPYNYNLSVNRANAVAEALYSRGVGQIALWRVGFGESVPLYPNDTPEHMSYNRRVEFLFAARTEPVLDVLKRQLDNICAAPDEAAAARCKQTIKVRANFEVIQLTSRSKTLAEPSAPNNISHGLGSSPKVAPLVVRKLSIDLRSQKTSIELPDS
jgi:outer membrane protein OmpA-like peptidoglycan-associated protein